MGAGVPINPQPDFAGTRRYQVVSRLGAGGMGVVYRVLDREKWVQVALKTLRQLDGEALLGLKQEFRSLQGISHPNLVGLGELGEEDGVWFFTMELIEGVDFLSWVRPDAARILEAESDPTLPAGAQGAPVIATPRGGRFDEARLRGALRDLALGLDALHVAGKVHRDIKPSNLRVDLEGRLVLLDFGLVADVAAGKEGSDAQVVGTVAYMAPEQASTRRIGPEADWYAAGVALFEALTGSLPFTGPPLAILLDKQQREPPSPRALVPEVPEDLDRLCSALLRIDPRARAGSREVLATVAAGEAPAPATGSSSGRATPFVGRAAELGALARAYRDAEAATVAVVIRGPSGVGKSTLVGRFVEAIAAPAGALVLTGRCSEREAVPYKALDGVIDALSQHLAAMPAAWAAPLVPPRAGLLARAFPVLLRVEPIARAPREGEGLDPQEQRLRLFAAVRELLLRLAARAPLVLAIDDLQWADEDSLALLADLLRPPDGPAMLLVATARGDGHDPVPALPGDVRTIELGNLPPDDARALAGRLLGSAEAGRIADEAAGHPLLLLELVRHAELHGAAVPAAMRLEDAIAARAARLAAPTRRLLELLAIAGAPVTVEVLAIAARGAGVAADHTELERGLAALRVGHLCRASGRRGVESVETYHDRVRAAIVAGCDTEATRLAHERLAVAFEAAGRHELEALAIHWRGAGDPARAAGYSVRAAEVAAQALAFERAARLYRSALADPGVAGAPALQVRLAEALANAGHAAEAAEVFLEAAAAPGADRGELLRRSAEQFLRSGRVQRGLEILDELLGAAGLPLAKTRRRALFAIVRNRARLALRGLRAKHRTAAEVPPALLARVDLAWSVTSALSTVDTFRSADLQTRGLLLALDAGDPFRMSRALALEAGMRAIPGARGRRRGFELQRRAAELARASGEPYAEALCGFIESFIHHQAGEWRKSHELLAVAEVTMRERCLGVSWELVNLHGMDLWNLGYLGRLTELGRCLERYTGEARERGDDYAAALRSGIANLVWLARGDLDGAIRDADEASRAWVGPDFALQHYYDVLARTHIDLYRGDAAAAAGRVERAMVELRRAFILRIEHVRIVMLHLRARCAIAAGDVRAAGRDLAGVEGRGMPWADGLARLGRAGAAARARPDAAIALLDEAAAAFDTADMALHAAVARRARGRLLGGDEGRALVAAAEAWMAGEGVASAEALSATIAPGLI